MRALVIGGARSGISAAKLLHKHGYQVNLVSNQDFEGRGELEEMGVLVVLDDKETDRFDNVDLVVKNPGIPNSHPLVKRFKHVINEIELGQRFNPSAKLYGISGTNGKTTTVSLLYKMLKNKDSHAILAGNVGIPYSGIVNQKGDQDCDVALELSSFQMENLPDLKLEVYALMNLSPDHLDRYDSLEQYYKVKADFGSRAKLQLRNADDAAVMACTQDWDNVINVSMKQKERVSFDGEHCLFDQDILFNIQDLKIVGDHNIMNAMFAATIAHLANASSDDIKAALQRFTGVEHRLEYIKTMNGARYYNDSKATNPESTEVALKAFKQDVILLAGGYDKKISFELLKQYESKLKAIYVFGDSALPLKDVFNQAIVVKDMEEALTLAHGIAVTGDTVLLSPACASFDQFKDYEERGRIFKELVRKL